MLVPIRPEVKLGVGKSQRLLSSLLLLGAVAGCSFIPTSPVLGGATGITVSADGELAVVASWCEQAPDGVEILRVVAGEWLDHTNLKNPRLSGNSLLLNLKAVPDGWTLVEGSLGLKEDEVYVARAYSSRTRVALNGVKFTVRSTEKLSPERILIQVAKAERDEDILLSGEEFSEQARSYC